jgi:preprotein translocase subunit SecA
MNLLERIWEVITVIFGGFASSIERMMTGVFGSSNARRVKRTQSQVDAIAALEDRYKPLSDEELREQTTKFRQRLRNGETVDDLLVEAFAICREAGWRFLKMRHYDVQMVGGMVLHSGAIGEMVTGEGKTLVATLPAYLNALEGKGVHVVTVNDYLARRDMEWMAPLYIGLGLTVGAIQSDMSVLERQNAYSCDITYGTNNEFGFDYLRDNMRPAARGDKRYPAERQQSQGPLHYAIIDEVDNILIDEARTPLIISGPAHQRPEKFSDADRVARQMKRDMHFVVNEKDHSAHMTDEGVRFAEKLAGVESFYTAGNMEWPHLIDNSLKAHYLYKRDDEYVVKEGRVVIVDSFTGRLMEGRQWSDGLHQAVEAKERVQIKEETQTLATITLQNFFKLYDKISGMTGTAMTEASEFWKIYQLEVVAIPTNRKMRRVEHPDVIYRSEREKFSALADEIEQLHKYDVILLKDGTEIYGDVHQESDESVEFTESGAKKKTTFPKSKVEAVEYKGRPILIGTVSIEKSETLAMLLEKRGVKHQVLNAKQHKREADIVAQAGRLGGVTIATNMAGRGTDIILGGNPETKAWAQLQEKYATRLDVPNDEWEQLVNEIEQAEGMKEQGAHVKSIGGLHVIGTERHESRRIDLQLRGRCGRQGDPGSSRFFLSLEDDLMRVFAGPWVKSILERLGMQEGERIESGMVTRRIEAAQKKVEERHFEARKSLLDYDEVMDEQRKRIYKYRQQILDGVICRDLVLEMIEGQVEHKLEEFLAPMYGIDSFAKFCQSKLSMEFEGQHFRGLEFDAAVAFAKDEAVRMCESHVADAIDENLPSEEEESEWNWAALAKFANTRWGLNFRDRDLKTIGAQQVDSFILEKAREAIDKIDLSEGSPLLAENFAIQQIIGWVQHKFGFVIDLDEAKALEPAALKELVIKRACEEYDIKERLYPVMAGVYQFSHTTSDGQRLDREAIVNWAEQRFDSKIDPAEIRGKTRDEIIDLLLARSAQNQQQANEKAAEMVDKVEELFLDAGPEQTAESQIRTGSELQKLCDFANENYRTDLKPDDLELLTRLQVERKMLNLVEDRYRAEIRKMERQLLLEIVDTAWKDHLLAMDHLRSSIGLVGYAQLDAKVEYKREGMNLYGEMWNSVDERTTDLFFRMEQLNEEFVGSTWVETQAIHDSPETTSDMAAQQQDAIGNSQSGERRVDPIRNRGEKVGRNEPCPCGSGKKYKNCCLRNRGVA